MTNQEGLEPTPFTSKVTVQNFVPATGMSLNLGLFIIYQVPGILKIALNCPMFGDVLVCCCLGLDVLETIKAR